MLREKCFSQRKIQTIIRNSFRKFEVVRIFII
jgi:hypothetical protein